MIELANESTFKIVDVIMTLCISARTRQRVSQPFAGSSGCIIVDTITEIYCI